MKKVLSLILAVMLMASCLTVVHAEDSAPIETVSDTYVNPLYDGELNISTIQPKTNSVYTNDTYYSSTEEAGKFMRGGLKQRAEIIAVNYVTRSFDESQAEAQAGAIAAEIAGYAFEHTGYPTEGDYLTWQYIGFEVYLDGYYQNSRYYLTFYFYNAYFTTAGEEAQTDAAVAALLPQLSGENDYEKVKAAYDWVTSNVTCTPMDENSELADFTAYGAIVNKSANSMGIANLMYRLLLELGIDNRIVYGTYNGTEQLWNIVCLVEEYYNIDAALDCGNEEYQYFLRCDANFGHVRDPLYDDEASHLAYPMDDEDYVHGAIKVLDSGYCGNNIDEVYWKFTSDGTLTIYGEGQMGDFDEINFNNHPWYDRRLQITNAVVEEGVTRIGNQAFFYHENLTAVSIPESVSAIGNMAFSGCTQITEITLPESVTSIGDEAFRMCYGITEIALPSGLTELGQGAFSGCTALKSIQIPNGITAINKMTFSGCYALKDVQLPDGLKEIGIWAFEYCSLETITIPETVTTIGQLAFTNTALTEVTIPNSVTELGGGAFSHCLKLAKVTLSENLTEIQDETFTLCSALTEITLPDSITAIGAEAFNACYALKALTIPENVTSIGRSAFQLIDGMELTFTGNPPEFHENALWNFTGTAYYPGTNENWTEDVLQNYGNNTITWVPYGLCEHEYTAATTAPTCTEQGYTTYTCTECGETYADDYVDALGHEFGDWYVTKEATCTVPGEEQNDCIHCEEFDTQEIPVIDHAYEAVVIDPTCTEQGYTTYTCSKCGESYIDNYVDALGHEFGDWYVTKEATCTVPGEEQNDCIRCEEFDTQEIPVIDHAYEAVVTAPTCTEQGCTTYTCSVCGDSYVEEYVAALGHSVSAWEVTTAPGCTDKGEESGICEICGETTTREVDATDHSFEEGTCTVCGAPEIAPGDANGDGTVNNVDAMLILQYAVGLKDAAELHLNACDVSGDGFVNNVDAMLILQYAVGLITEFTKK